ncbi:MAG: M48 family metallopeptidase [Pseudomonadota bacterium]
MNAFAHVFLAAVVLGILTRLWLGLRHMRHVARHRDRVPANFAGHVSPEAHRKAADYTVAKTRLHCIDEVVSALVVLALTLGGGVQWFHDVLSVRFEPGGYMHGIALIGGVVLFTSLVDLPFTLYRTFGIEARFGFNRITPRLFVADQIKHLIVAAVLGIPLLFVVLWLMNAMGDWWWLYVWLTWMGFNLLLLVLFPTVIAPLFNKFTPLEDEQLRTRIENLLARCGFRSKGVYVMDGSRRSSHGNAYFTGLGAAKRIVFFDTLLSRLAAPEIEAVLAHELGHFKLRHIAKRLAWMAMLSLGFLAALAYLMQQDWFYRGLGVEAQGTAVALLLFLLAVPAFTYFALPLANAYSRKHEYEADAYAAQHASAGDLVQALVKLYRDNAATLTPDPLHSAFYDSHPPAGLRIARLQSFRPQEAS